MMERLERLKYVISTIKQYEYSERGFDKLHSLLLDEIRHEMNENADRRSNPYLNNLVQTKDKQARSYIQCKNKNKGSEYEDFIRNFKNDVTTVLHQYKCFDY